MVENDGAWENTPLLSSTSRRTAAPAPAPAPTLISRPTFRESVHQFLEAQTPLGKWYEKLTIGLILVNMVAFVLASLFVTEYNAAPWADPETGICGMVCDALWFGNYASNPLSSMSLNSKATGLHLHLGTTSVLEVLTVLVFSGDYLLRVWTADLEHPRFKGLVGRLRYLPTFYSLVDLASTVPFYVDACLPGQDIAASQFLRMFRLFRMMRVEGRYDMALGLLDDVFRLQRAILATALFVGVTTWAAVSSLYYLVERRTTDLIYCGRAPDYCGDPQDIDTSLCLIDSWGIVDCSTAGCPASDAFPEPCYNLYRSIPMASYYALLNLFGEFPLIDQHSAPGMIVGTFVAVVAVAVFALPAGIIGNGLEQILGKRREDRMEREAAAGISTSVDTTITSSLPSPSDFIRGDETTMRGRCYNFLHPQTSPGSAAFDYFLNFLVLGTALTFMLETVSKITDPTTHILFDTFELLAVVIFTVEFAVRTYSATEDPKYASVKGLYKYSTDFLPLVDLLSIVPYWIYIVAGGGHVISPYADVGSIWMWTTGVKCLRLLRLLRFEKYTHAFTTFDDVIRLNIDVFAVTGFTAFILWVFFGAILYYTERNNPDPEMASNYNTVPNAMWVTLLNLSGESPLCQYSIWGKVATGIIGLFASGVFGIPIGVLGSGFEEIVVESTDDTPDDEATGTPNSNVLPLSKDDENGSEEQTHHPGNYIQRVCYQFVNGQGSKMAMYFEVSIYVLILITVTVGIFQTVEGHENSFHQLEWIAVTVFTIEYLLRTIGAPADPEFRRSGSNPVVATIRYLFSFYSVVDLLAIVPFYLAVIMPGSWVDDHDEYLRMFRLLRLIKLDKYVPSITLIDDVIRLKRRSLIITGFAAGTMWIIFASLLYLGEHEDTSNEIDPVPSYGCASECTMSDRFQSYFDSLVYTGIHLTGDYPIITYDSFSRVVCFVMVIAAVGVVSVPSGLIASGFAEIVQSKMKAKQGGEEHIAMAGGDAGDDWYEFRYRELEGQEPPPSRFGPMVDTWQNAVNIFLNGQEDPVTGKTIHTNKSFAGRVFIFTIIITNVLAVIFESIPEVDKAVGNQAGNFFDVFEMCSVMVFAAEYLMRLFCAPKNRGALFSTWVYATTFFGIVDLLSTAPWFVEEALIYSGHLDSSGDNAKIFRIFRIFRILQLEDFMVAFSKLDNVFRASKDVLKATGLMALIIWVGCGALFFIFEENNPNWRSCDSSIPLMTGGDDSNYTDAPGCYDFESTRACNEFYPGMCSQAAFTNVPNALYFTAVFLVGEWGVVDFTWPGRLICLFLCVAGIALYAIPVGTLFDSFGAVLGMGGDDEEEPDEDGCELGEATNN